MTHNTNTFTQLQDELKKKEKEIHKMLNGHLGKLSEVLKQAEFKQTKKGKVNKKPATMYLAHDNSVKIVFDDPEAGINFFGK